MTQQSTPSGLASLRKEVDDWVAEHLSRHTAEPVRAGKIIRDGVHGFQHIHAHEVALIDTPLIQRLRYIHQTALAYLIYPTMTHTRYDHSLGMAFVADSMIRSIKNRYPDGVTERTVQIVRLSALLHDTGHTIFSHMGEGIVDARFSDLFNEIKRTGVNGRGKFFEEANSGEILSYLIATCPAMKTFLGEQFAIYRGQGCELLVEDIDVAAGLIVAGVDNEDKQYLADIINGPIDADKLDYIRRDCYFSGIRAEIDVPRIVYGLDWIDQPGWPRFLTTDSSVIPQLEQILLAKLLLYTSIYHHHKVRTLECMMRSVFDSLADGSPVEDRLKLDSVTKFLDIQEFQFLTWGFDEPLIGDQIKAILNRRLLKRALVINQHTVEPRSQNKLTSLRSKIPNAQALREARSLIYDSLSTSHKTNLRELWLDIPKPPDTDEEARLCWVKFGNAEFMTLAQTLPTNDWIETYEAHKLNYFVFYNADENLRMVVADKAGEYLRDTHEIHVTDRARTLARL